MPTLAPPYSRIWASDCEMSPAVTVSSIIHTQVVLKTRSVGWSVVRGHAGTDGSARRRSRVHIGRRPVLYRTRRVRKQTFPKTKRYAGTNIRKTKKKKNMIKILALIKFTIEMRLINFI